MIAGNAFSQGYPGLAGIHYSTGFTLGDTKNFIDEYSWRGFNLEYKKFLSQNIIAGFTTGWNIFDEKRDKDTIILESGAITGTQIRYFNAFPVMASFEYYLGNKRSNIRPYLGVNVGTYYIIQRLEVGVFQVEEDNWHFGLAPVVGILIPTDYIFLQLSARYNYAAEAGESIGKEAWDFSYMTFNIGISVPTW
jgi:hypothetical protein